MKKGFTMVELVIVTAIFGVVFIVVSNTFFNVIKAALKAEAYKEVRQNGDVSLGRISKDIRDATAITPCGANSTTITFTDTNDVDVTYVLTQVVPNNRQLSRQNELITDQRNVNFPDDTSLTFTCTNGQVDIGFTLQYVPFGNAALIQRSEDRVQMQFETTVVNRNFDN